MKESIIEKYLDARVQALGGETRKVTYQGRTGAFDRWCFMPAGKLIIVEVKAPGKKLKPDQVAEFAWLVSRGFVAHVVDSKDAVDEILAGAK